LILDTQRAGEPCAWLTRRSSSFFPPDLAASGIDLEALAVIFTPSAPAAVRAAGRLVRSGGFGLVVVDLGSGADIPSPLQGRLSSLALKHDTAIVLITQKPSSSPSLGSMISLRVEAKRIPLEGARFSVQLDVLKDKRRGPGWSLEEIYQGPAGWR
jgi:recombination protein RecA